VISVRGLGDITAPIHVKRNDNGAEFVIGLHGPLTPDDPPDAGLRDLKEYGTSVPVLLCDEMVVRRNLPSATSTLISRMG
jgi:hypothetical protein